LLFGIKIDAAAAEIQQQQCQWVETAAELLVVCPFVLKQLAVRLFGRFLSYWNLS